MIFRFKVGDRVKTTHEGVPVWLGTVRECFDEEVYPYMVCWDSESDLLDPMDDDELEFAENGLETMLKISFEKDLD